MKEKTNKKTRDLPSGAERRRYKRVPLNLLVQHRFESLDSFLEEVASDISVGGLFLKTENPKAVGTTVYLRFALSDGLPLIEGIGEVVWCHDKPESDSSRGMGIEFVSLDEESRKLIESIVGERYAEKNEQSTVH